MLEIGTDYCNANASCFVVRQMCKRKPECCRRHSVEAKVIIRISYLQCLNWETEWRSVSGQGSISRISWFECLMLAL